MNVTQRMTADRVNAPLPALAPVQSLAQLLAVMELRRHEPVISLRQALEQMHLLDAATLDALQAEDPGLLRSKSRELVGRLVITEDDLEHALARVAGLVEVDAVRFDVPPEAFQVLHVREARLHEVVPLGEAEDRFFVASSNPTDETLRRQLCDLTGHNVSLVWASREAIELRLDLQESAGASAPRGMAPAHPGAHSLPPATGSRSDAQDIELLVSQALIEISAGQEHEEAASASESSGMVRMVKKMIDDALARDASDIHVETNPGEQITLIRFRRDGDSGALPAPARAAAGLAGLAHQDHGAAGHRRAPPPAGWQDQLRRVRWAQARAAGGGDAHARRPRRRGVAPAGDEQADSAGPPGPAGAG